MKEMIKIGEKYYLAKPQCDQELDKSLLIDSLKEFPNWVSRSRSDFFKRDVLPRNNNDIRKVHAWYVKELIFYIKLKKIILELNEKDISSDNIIIYEVNIEDEVKKFLNVESV